MEQIKNQNVTKPVKKASQYSAVRISNPTQRKLTNLLNKVNKKDFGKRVRGDALIEVALELLSEHHIKSLQNKSLSNSDLLEMRFRDHVKKNGKISKDDYLGFLLKEAEKTAS